MLGRRPIRQRQKKGMSRKKQFHRVAHLDPNPSGRASVSLNSHPPELHPDRQYVANQGHPYPIDNKNTFFRYRISPG
jgi:hypothetical protein